MSDQAIPDAQKPIDAPDRPRRRWWVVPLAGSLCFLIVPGFYMYRHVRRRRAIAALEALGKVHRGKAKPRPWPMSLLPRYDRPVLAVDLNGTSADDRTLAYLEGLTGLETLCLNDTAVTDAALARLEGMTRLRVLSLEDTRITDAGLAHIRGLTELSWLLLAGTGVTDAGLAHLEGLPKLQMLNLMATRITDAGLTHLYGLTRLRWLLLGHTEVTLAGVTELRMALPNVRITR
jgi:hypothetical protein